MSAASVHYGVHHAIGTFGIHRVSSISGDSASYGYLVISSKYITLVLLETMSCRTENSSS